MACRCYVTYVKEDNHANGYPQWRLGVGVLVGVDRDAPHRLLTQIGTKGKKGVATKYFT